MNTPVVMSYGLGVDSTAILLRWLREPSSRDFDLADLTLVTAMTGDEWEHTKRDVETHVLPLLREHGIRFIQVARSQRYVSKGAGVRVLSDTTQPTMLHLEGDYRLSDEMLDAGTVPQSGGARICSIHAKGEVLDPTIADVTNGHPYRHVLGFEANEQNRARKDATKNTARRTGEYPLIEWDWDRQRCLNYIREQLGVTWYKSACVYCPFSLQNKASLAQQLELYARHPEAAVAALFMEEVALALNPRQSLNPRKPLGPVIAAAGLHDATRAFLDQLNEAPHAVYEVRRIIRPRKGDPTKMANAPRSVRTVLTGTRSQMIQLIQSWGAVSADGFYRLYLQERAATLPTTERFLTVAPAVVRDKQVDHFEQWWQEATANHPSRLAEAV